MAFEIGKIQTVVGTGEEGYAGDGGPAAQALIGEAYGCDFDTAGNLYISDGRTHTIRRIDKDSGIITTVAGSGRQGYSGDGGPATEATLDNLYSLQVDTNGDIYIVDRLNAAIRKVDAATGIITTVAGTGEPGYSGDGGPGVLGPVAGAERLLSGWQGRPAHRGHSGSADTPSGPEDRHHYDLRGQWREAADRGWATRHASLHHGRPGGLHGSQREHLHLRA